MTTPWSLLLDRVAADGASPLVTMYDDATGERVELSGVTFMNWVAKTANLLADLDVSPGDAVEVALPEHWQTLVLRVALSAVGASDGPGDVRAVTKGAGPDDLVFSLLPMGRGLPAPGPGVDYAVEVRLHGDQFRPPAALSGAELVPSALPPPGARILAVSGSFEDLFLAPLAAGGSLVLVLNEDPSTRPGRIASERVTHVLADGVYAPV